MTAVAKPASIAMIALGFLLWGLGGCDRGEARKPSAPGLSVILISIDTTRADHIACYGHQWIRTPNIDRLAAEGTLFAQCTAAVPITLPSHASMLTGTYPFVHKVRDNGTFQLHSDNLTLTEVLRDAGYATAAQVGAFVLNHEFGLDQGFASYRDVAFTAPTKIGGRPDTEINAEQVTDGAIELLQTVAGERFFLFVHYFDPHQRYQAPPRFTEQYLDPYLAEIAYTDEQIGRLLAAVQEADADDKTLIVLTSDHGEGRGQHFECTHAFYLHDSTLSVPLIFWCPGRIPAGGRITAQVRTVDIAPTILSLLGQPELPDAQGVDLSPLISGKTTDLNLTAYSETFCTKYALGFSQLRALRDGQWKYIHAPRPELYNTALDWRELEDRASSQPERVAEMRAALRALIESAPHVVEPELARRALVTPQDLRALEMLGYVGGAPATEEESSAEEMALFDPDGPNPAEHIRTIQLLVEALGLVGSEQHERLERVLRSLLSESGERSQGFAWAHTHLAGALAAQNRLEEALEHFEIAVRARPDDGQLHTAKAMVLRGLGRGEEAIAALQTALTLEPVFALTHSNLGAALAAAGRDEQAVEQYRLAIEKEPSRMRDHTGLVNSLAKLGRLAEAVSALDSAIEVARKSGAQKTVDRLQTLRKRLRR